MCAGNLSHKGMIAPSEFETETSSLLLAGGKIGSATQIYPPRRVPVTMSSIHIAQLEGERTSSQKGEHTTVNVSIFGLSYVGTVCEGAL